MPGASPTICTVATGYGGTHGGRPRLRAAPPDRGQPPYRRRTSTRRRWFAAVAALVVGVAGLAVSLLGVAFQLLPRQFTAQQRRQITDWEAGRNWRLLPAGKLFPASVPYAAPAALDDDAALRLTAGRIGIAAQSSCAAATDTAVGAVLARNGCEAMLRATYADGTDSYVVTVGVAPMPGSAQAGAAARELAGLQGAAGAGVRTVPVSGTPAAAFTDSRRQLSASMTAGPYLILYTIGYTGDLPHVAVGEDRYADAEMSHVGRGVAQAVAAVLDPPVKPPGCPGTPGC